MDKQTMELWTALPLVVVSAVSLCVVFYCVLAIIREE